MGGENTENKIDRRKVLRTTGAAVGGGLAVGASGTAAASSRGRGHSNDDGSEKGCAQGNKRGRGRGSEKCSRVQEISTDGDVVVTFVEVLGEKFLFREAAAYRNADDVSALSDDRTYEATESGHPVEFGQIDSPVSASDLDSGGAIEAQGIDFTPENFIEDYDVDFKQICDGCCDDIAWKSHYALEINIEGGGALASLSVASIAALLCYAAGASAAIPTAGWSGGAAAVGCTLVTGAIDQLIDVEMIPNSVEMTVAFWDQDETNYWGWNTSPTIAVGLAPEWEVNYDEITKIGEYDNNVHLWY
jgi:hypothetical protein